MNRVSPAHLRRFCSCGRGNVAMTFGLGALVLAGMAGFGITASHMNATGMRLQDQADAFALNAAVAIQAGSSFEQAATSAQRQGGPDQTVALHKSGEQEITATTTGDVKVTFGGLLGQGSVTMEREATAVIGNGDPVCLLVLSPAEPSAFSRRGASSLQAPRCAVQVNSTANGPLESRGNGVVETLRTLASGRGTPTPGFSPSPIYGVPVVADPYAKDIVWPSSEGCSPADLSLRKETLTLRAGVHCGDIELGPGANLNLGPGVHVLAGSLSMRSGAVLTTATGTTLVFVGSSSTITVQAGADLQVIAPSTGPWAGIAIAVKPQPTEHSSDIQGGGNIVIDGTVYLPTQQLFVTGGGSLAEPTEATRMFVVNRFELRGNGRVFLNARASPVLTSGSVRLSG